MSEFITAADALALMNGDVTKEGITADPEAMAEARMDRAFLHMVEGRSPSWFQSTWTNPFRS